ncbi:MAG TPA: nucleoside 2-deoxyribosyltransferase domain-containing protein [Anaerolineae bacterium]|nr:nucleoside 2-deoxyribosyltransferase domain-containing protein [Anaerolineae bacterium]
MIKAPAALVWREDEYSVFLAGSIAMGAAGPWQAEIGHILADHDGVLLNPRRESWDASWEQTIENEQFREQVEWELEAQERADFIFMYFEPTTQAPITLLEFGLFARSGKLMVISPNGFWRRGNLEVSCAYYNIPLYATWDEGVAALKKKLKQ